MSPHHWLASFLIAFHLIALTLAAIPQPSERAPIEPLQPRQSDGASSTLSAGLNRFAALMASAEGSLLSNAHPIRQLTQPYVNAGLPQVWIMFSQPWTHDQYVRIDHYIRSDHGQHVTRELVLPAQREEKTRLVHAFRDKTINRTVEAYLLAIGDESSEQALAERPVAESRMEALVRHARSGGRPDGPGGGADFIRSEVWYGRAPIPRPGVVVDLSSHRERLEILEGYRTRVLEGAPAGPTYRLWASQREADITWQLIYIQQP